MVYFRKEAVFFPIIIDSSQERQQERDIFYLAGLAFSG
jgi:hypothetical protein